MRSYLVAAPEVVCIYVAGSRLRAMCGHPSVAVVSNEFMATLVGISKLYHFKISKLRKISGGII